MPVKLRPVLKWEMRIWVHRGALAAYLALYRPLLHLLPSSSPAFSLVQRADDAWCSAWHSQKCAYYYLLALLVFLLDQFGTFVFCRHKIEAAAITNVGYGTVVSFDTPTSWNAQDGYIRVCFPWIARMQWHPFSFYPVCSHLLSRRSTRQTAPRNLNALLQYEVVVGWFSGVGESCVLHCRRPAAERQDQFSLISFPCNMISLRPAVLQEHRSPQEQHPSDLHGSRAKSSIFIQAVGD